MLKMIKIKQMDKQNRNKWTYKFSLLAKNKSSHQDYINLYKEMKKEKDNQENKSNMFKKVISKFLK